MNLSKDRNPREIPTKQDPTVPYPEKAPETQPGQDNPRNPQDDEGSSFYKSDN